VIGDDDLAERFVAMIDPLRWRPGGIEEAWIREIRRIKARVESERLPRGADPHRHTKLGRGGLADIEWTVQLLQLCHAGDLPELRLQGTLPALAAATAAGLVAAGDSRVLADAWRLASRARNAVVLWSGRPSDSLPTNQRDLDGVARLVGYPPASAERFEDDYQRTTRRARAVVERLFYG
jgi:glutamate-ammonia-ligase adenylyltransferase